ncbi:unnamed protein product [Rotaria sp. Silwood1]|nr:unnamed protein product [Rotaria sp. Silwood1]CAF0755502.1 unnamed protein product [Rotaria sp. Silwood1]CAF3354384.1 unnamed protein product [Rotaria sp. Silwood1]CAF4548460.1 unnamed protein product [Rotaria sp. Silwood1]CAF4624838.1 unnamed protein product [Rotaria sp. Silwood1]
MMMIKHFCPSNPTICLCRTVQVFPKSIYYLSTNVDSLTNENKKQKIHSQYPLLDTKFNQYRIAYHYRRSIELLRGYLVFRIFSIHAFVNHQDKIAYWGRRILGDRLFKNILKVTAFGHFVGGETPKEITPAIKRLLNYNVKPILDYSVESDDNSPLSSSSQIDLMHDHNTTKFIECIQTSHDLCGPNNLVAIKVTALIRPNVLKKFNTILKSMKNRSSLPPLFELINQEQTNNKIVVLFQDSVNKNLKEDQNQISSNVTFLPDDLTEIHNLLIRLNKIAEACLKHQISIMIDAEQTYFQTAINYLATELQRYYNKSNTPVIYGTYQCYLKDTLNSLKYDLALAEKYNYIFAAKLVRGAYMEQENRLAREYGYESPINPSFEATSQMYHTCLDEVLNNIAKRKPEQVRIMVASHNEDTVRYAIQEMKDYDIRHDSSIVSFASLYGMNDYVAFALANSGYTTYKYLPYGPIEVLQPYLFRRAQENRAIFEKAGKDRRFHFKALKDRMFNSKN